MTRLSHRWVLAAPIAGALAALAAWPAAAHDNALRAQRIVIDRDTGRPRLPEHDELAATPASAAAGPATNRSAARSEPSHPAAAALQSHPAAGLLKAQPLAAQLGAKGHRVDASRLSFTVVRRGADGKAVTQCVTGDAALAKALDGSTEGGAHDH